MVLEGSFVDTATGTGIVHMAPAFGEDDYALCTSRGIELFDPVDHQGRFTEAAPDWTGLSVFEANKPIARRLRETGALFAQESYRHRYPHCWRCDQPLIYRAISSWYVRVSDNRETLLACNEPINWVPSHIGTGRFRNWLADARDWSVSRNRYWGTPIPVWKCSACGEMEVPGSLAELEAKTGQKVEDLHRPFCDELTWGCSKPGCSGAMRRVPEVFDCWFESGAMPYGQAHYPFEHKDWFDANYPPASSWNTSPRPGAGSTPCWWRGAPQKPGSVPELHLPRRGPGRGRPQDVQAAEKLPGPHGGGEQVRLRRPAHLPAHPRRWCAASTCASPSATWRTRSGAT